MALTIVPTADQITAAIQGVIESYGDVRSLSDPTITSLVRQKLGDGYALSHINNKAAEYKAKFNDFATKQASKIEKFPELLNDLALLKTEVQTGSNDLDGTIKDLAENAYKDVFSEEEIKTLYEKLDTITGNGTFVTKQADGTFSLASNLNTSDLRKAQAYAFSRVFAEKLGKQVTTQLPRPNDLNPDTVDITTTQCEQSISAYGTPTALDAVLNPGDEKTLTEVFNSFKAHDTASKTAIQAEIDANFYGISHAALVEQPANTEDPDLKQAGSAITCLKAIRAAFTEITTYKTLSNERLQQPTADKTTAITAQKKVVVDHIEAAETELKKLNMSFASTLHLQVQLEQLKFLKASLDTRSDAVLTAPGTPATHYTVALNAITTQATDTANLAAITASIAHIPALQAISPAVSAKPTATELKQCADKLRGVAKQVDRIAKETFPLIAKAIAQADATTAAVVAVNVAAAAAGQPAPTPNKTTAELATETADNLKQAIVTTKQNAQTAQTGAEAQLAKELSVTAKERARDMVSNAVDNVTAVPTAIRAKFATMTTAAKSYLPTVSWQRVSQVTGVALVALTGTVLSYYMLASNTAAQSHGQNPFANSEGS